MSNQTRQNDVSISNAARTTQNARRVAVAENRGAISPAISTSVRSDIRTRPQRASSSVFSVRRKCSVGFLPRRSRSALVFIKQQTPHSAIMLSARRSVGVAFLLLFVFAFRPIPATGSTTERSTVAPALDTIPNGVAFVQRAPDIQSDTIESLENDDDDDNNAASSNSTARQAKCKIPKSPLIICPYPSNRGEHMCHHDDAQRDAQHTRDILYFFGDGRCRC